MINDSKILPFINKFITLPFDHNHDIIKIKAPSSLKI